MKVLCTWSAILLHRDDRVSPSLDGYLLQSPLIRVELLGSVIQTSYDSVSFELRCDQIEILPAFLGQQP